jgi:hypothetical protein
MTEEVNAALESTPVKKKPGPKVGSKHSKKKAAPKAKIAKPIDYVPADQKEDVLLPASPLEELSLAQLREKAINVYRLPITTDMRKQDIISAILGKMGDKKANFAIDAASIDVDRIPPGYAKIILFKDQTQGALNFPHPFQINGQMFVVPRGVEVMVPLKVYWLMNDMKEKVKQPDPQHEGRYVTIEVHRMPFQLMGFTPGPDPKPDYAAYARARPRKQFRDLFGFWPGAAEMKEALKDGLIQLQPQEKI